MSEEQAKAIAEILFGHETNNRDLDDWDLTLTCDHTVRHNQHRDHQRYSTSVVRCPTCGERRGVVEAVHVGPTEDPTGEVQQDRVAAELRAAEAKLKRQRKAAARTEQQIAAIAKELGGNRESSGG
ncbi:type II toxin-antitoxin system VapC family toxin [Streptomyces caniscabiei]|uniref:type II toxin-antitoxin system VapC family toxin n=1 Tax=Streptomyces caniscabiei TaxID=2746961 RepID=UPI00117E2C4D|nr:type II toxin-antitoxin system VapC family toxin [Streptomyces caniscabiei]